MLENLISVATLIRAYLVKKMEKKIAVPICLLGTAEYVNVSEASVDLHSCTIQ